MKFVQEFTVGQPVDVLWALFDQPETVAGCLPGMESIEVIDADNFIVQVRQSVGPISATFESRVHVNERIAPSRLHFSTTGKAIRGAIGNFRAESTVTLLSGETGTAIRVETEAALAGVLGSVGQKIIARQAEKIAADFAGRLEEKLSGRSDAAPDAPPTAVAEARSGAPALPRPAAAALPTAPAVWSGALPAPAPAEGWGRVAVALMAVNIAIGLAILVKLS